MEKTIGTVEKDIPFIKIPGLEFPDKELKPKSIYDLKTKVDADLLITIDYLLKKIQVCDIDPEVYFMLQRAKDQKELCYNIQYILYIMSPRKYDDNTRNILLTLKFLLDINPKYILDDMRAL